MAALLVASGLVVLGAPPAAAEIAGISPARLEVEPGASVSTTVTVRASGVTCLDARPSDASLQPTFATGCDDEPEWRTAMSVQAPNTPGTYSVRVTDDQSGDAGGRTFTLVVRSPAATTVPPTTDTTAAPSSTATTPPAGPTTTTGAPTTTTTTVAASTTTTTAAPSLDGDPFTPLADLAGRPMPSEGVFLPLLGEGWRDCLPLTEPCGHPGSGLLLVPARGAELTWQPVPEGAAVAPRADLRGTAPLAAVGVSPADPLTQNYALSILDLTAPGGQLRTLLRGMDEQGRLVTVSAARTSLRATLAHGAADASAGSTALSAMPFGAPVLRKASTFTETAPALAMFASAEPQLLYALRPDPAWAVGADLVPLLGESVPFLVRGIEGSPGLFLARQPGLRVGGEGAAEAEVTAEVDGDDNGGGAPVLGLLAGAVGLGVVATAAIAILRRRRVASTPRGT